MGNAELVDSTLSAKHTEVRGVVEGWYSQMAKYRNCGWRPCDAAIVNNDDVKDVALAMHNTLRAKHSDTPPMQWDDEVAASAQRYAETCPTGHSPKGSVYRGSDSGENLAWHSATGDTTGIQRWYDEIRDYDWTSPPGHRGVTGHFTQLVWDQSTRLGCAVKYDCPQWGTTWVCQYAPAGNYVGEFARHVHPLLSEAWQGEEDDEEQGLVVNVSSH